MSRVMVFGSKGFIGRHVVNELDSHHEVYGVTTAQGDQRTASNEMVADLLDKESIYEAVSTVQPDVIINCAGVVDPNKNIENNITYTANIIESLARIGLKSTVIVSGSAGSYGRLKDESELPVKETVPLRADYGYALTKKNEEETALMLSMQLDIPVIILRIFNPIGVGMADKFFIPRILKQIEAIKHGNQTSVEVSRLDAKRDYIAVGDVARAFRAVIERGEPPHNVYNVGSGVAISNGDLLNLVIKSSKIEPRPAIVETQLLPEPLIASQADIARICTDFGWSPRESLDSIIKEIVREKTD